MDPPEIDEGLIILARDLDLADARLFRNSVDRRHPRLAHHERPVPELAVFEVQDGPVRHRDGLAGKVEGAFDDVPAAPLIHHRLGQDLPVSALQDDPLESCDILRHPEVRTDAPRRGPGYSG
ncbi:MAG: hypothetical protein IJL56_05210 [Bacteroidales bacterium]|nr:hypothetical protein [Bacteroidales bacterium]